MSCITSNIYDICVSQNASFELNFKLYDDTGSSSLDITSWSVEAAIKDSVESPTPLMFFTTSIDSYVSASINLFLGAGSTWALSGSARYVYDVIAHNPTATPPETYRLLQGKVSINKGVTAP